MSSISMYSSSSSSSESGFPSTSQPYTFNPKSNSRALPLSAALLRANPALQAAVRQFETQQQKFEAAFVVPRTSSTPRNAYLQDEEDEWSEDGSESDAGEEWEVTDEGMEMAEDEGTDGEEEEEYYVPSTPELPSATMPKSLSYPLGHDLRLFDTTENPEMDIDETLKRAMRFAGWFKVQGEAEGGEKQCAKAAEWDAMPAGLRSALSVVVA